MFVISSADSIEQTYAGGNIIAFEHVFTADSGNICSQESNFTGVGAKSLRRASSHPCAKT